MSTKPSLREYSAVGADFVKLSNAVQESSTVSDETKQKFSDIADDYSQAEKRASANRNETYGDAHKTWQNDNEGPFVSATAQAKELLNNPVTQRETSRITADPKGDKITSRKLAANVRDVMAKERLGYNRNPGYAANSPAPLVTAPAVKHKSPSGVT